MPSNITDRRPTRPTILSGPLYPARNQRRATFAGAAMTLLTGAVLLGSGPSAQAASAAWNASPTDGNWEATGTENNWSTGVATYPGALSSTTNTDVATFLTSSVTTIAINSAAGNTLPLGIGSITFGSSAATSPSSFTIGSTSGNSLLLGNSGTISISSSVVAAAAATETINAPLVLEPASATAAGVYSFSNGAASSANTMVFNGAISGGTTTGTTTLTLTGANAGSNLINGVVSDGGAGTGLAVAKTSSGTWALTNTNTYSGATTVNQGTLTLANNATAGTVGSAAASAITVGQTGTAVSAVLALDSSAATASQTTTRGASLTFNAASGGNGFTSFTQTSANATGLKTVDNFTGALTLNTGTYVLPSLNAGTLGYGQLNFGSFVRGAGSVIDFSRGTTTATVGTTTIASQTAAKNNVTFTTAPTLTGGTLGTTSAGIVKGAFVNQTIATYDTTNGLRQLNTTTEMAALAASGQTTQNASLTGAGTVTLTADESVNSLSLGFGTGSGGITAGAFKLTVTSGVISVGQNSMLGNATVDFGTTEGIILTQNTRALTINSVLTGSGGATFTMEGTNNATGFSILNAANTYTGITRFSGNNNTSARLTNSLALQNTTLDYNNYGGTFVFGNGTTTGQTAYTFGGLQGAQNIALTNNNATNQSVALTVGSAGDGDSTTYSGVLSNGAVAGGSLIKAGSGTLTLTGVNTFTGSTTVNQGTLALGVARATAATSGISVAPAATLTLTATSALATPVATTGTLGNTVAVTGQVPVTLGGGTLARSGTGVSLGSQSGTAGTVGIGMLTLTSASTLDFGATGVGTLNLSSFSDAGNFLLTVLNYTHTTAGTGVDGTDDRLIFNQDVSTLLSDFSINGQTPTQVALGNGEFEVIGAAVPEPSTWVGGLLGLGVLGFRLRRRAAGTFLCPRAA